MTVYTVQTPDADLACSGRFDAVISDLDGCLAPEDGGLIDIEGLARLAAHNRTSWERRDRPMLTLCTGRPVSFVECMSRAIANHLPVIAENGVWVWEPRTGRHEIDPAITPELLAAVREAERWVALTLGPRGVTMQPGKTASVSLHHEDGELLHGLIDEVRGAFGELGLPMRVSATWHYLNCDLEIVSKTTGIRRFQRLTGLATGRLAGIGDTLPDLKIRDGVAWFACPSNAREALKPSCDYVASGAMLDGVLEILERLTTGPDA